MLRIAGIPEAQLSDMMASLARVIDLRDPTRTPGEPYVMSYTPAATLRELPGSTGSGATVVPPPAGLRRIDI